MSESAPRIFRISKPQANGANAMTTTARIKDEYLAQVRELFGDCPDELRAVEELWEDGRFREVYFRVYGAICRRGIALSTEQRRIDESFYWGVVH